MADGTAALVIIGAGIGGYAIYRHWKRSKDRETRFRIGFDPFDPRLALPAPSPVIQATSGNFGYPWEDVTGLYPWSHAHR